MKTMQEKFWAKVDKSGDCWIWQGFKTAKGYGRTTATYKNLRAHRVAYELENGPIPEGLVIMHTCDNPSCVNPGHLKAGTLKENAQDMGAKGRSWQQAKTHCPQGHEYTPENTRIHPVKGGRECRFCRRLQNKRRLQAQSNTKTT